MRIEKIIPRMVELAPKHLEPGLLYISEKYAAAVHLCCCGCGEKVVTPISAAEWSVSLRGGLVTVRPSIGNWSMPCQSHYWIRESHVIWSGQLSKRQIQNVFERDQRDLKAMHNRAGELNKTQNVNRTETGGQKANPRKSWFTKLMEFVQRFLR
jgi:hypothetical protein